MPSPTDEIFTEISKDFNIRWNFRNCIASTSDSIARRTSSQYFNHKQYHSIVLQAVVDANLKFVAADVEAFGKQSDGGFFRISDLYQSLETRSLQVPEDTVLPRSEITLPHFFFCW